MSADAASGRKAIIFVTWLLCVIGLGALPAILFLSPLLRDQAVWLTALVASATCGFFGRYALRLTWKLSARGEELWQDMIGSLGLDAEKKVLISCVSGGLFAYCSAVVINRLQPAFGEWPPWALPTTVFLIATLPMLFLGACVLRDQAAHNAREGRERSDSDQRRLARIAEDEKQQRLQNSEAAKKNRRDTLIAFERVKVDILQCHAVLGRDLDQTLFTPEYVADQLRKWQAQLDDGSAKYVPTVFPAMKTLADEMILAAAKRNIERLYAHWQPVIEHRLPESQLRMMLDALVRRFSLGDELKQVKEDIKAVEQTIERLARESEPEYRARQDNERAEHYFKMFDQLEPATADGESVES
jgi:hypothetical protein